MGCGREFLTKEKEQKFCSHSCAAKKMHSERPVTTDTTNIVVLHNSDNPRYSQDIQGQWWYHPAGEKEHQRTRAYIRTCERCGAKFLISIFHSKIQKFCSRRCALRDGVEANPGRFKGDKGSNWKGGRFIHASGYVMVWCPDHPSRQNTTKAHVQEHRLVVEKALGRYLTAKEVVHHVNENKIDNRLINLMVFPDHILHAKFHGNPPEWIPRCKCCGKPNPEVLDGRPEHVPLIYELPQKN